MMTRKNCVFFIVFLFTAVHTAAQIKTEKVWYEVSYYPEYMPYERVDEDIRMMKEAGINVVRMGESTWSLFEPREGDFQFEWMDRVLDKLYQAEISIIIGTPTYSVPAWLAHKHPEILLQFSGGTKAYYGSRQNMDITNPTYLFYCERIIRKMMEHYAKHPAVIGYQVDNETTSYNVNNYDAVVGFVNYVKEKFKSLEALNKAWGLNYWGLNINSWEEFPAPDGAVNPSYNLEWERYKRKIVTGFLDWQSRIVNEYKKTGQFVMHDFTRFIQDIDHPEAARNMDVMAANLYHPQQDGLTGVEIAFLGDYFRNIKKNNYLVTETNAQTYGSSSQHQNIPYEGQLRMNVYAHLASGANMIGYWPWHSIHSGPDMFWKGILSHDMGANRAYKEISRTGNELKSIGSRLVNLKKTNKVAILFSPDSYYGIVRMMYSDRSNAYLSEWVNPIHNALYRKNIESDIILDRDDFSKYNLLIIPPLFIAADSLLKKISDYVKNGGHVVMAMKSGFCDENYSVRAQMAPGPLRKVCGFYYQDFVNIGATGLKEDPFGVGSGKNKVRNWAECIIPETAVPIAFYDDKRLGKFPAITRNQFGKGTLTYIGTVLSNELLSALLVDEVKRSGSSTPAQWLSYPLIVRSGMNDKGKTLHYMFNYSDEAQVVSYPFKAGNELLDKMSVGMNDQIKIGPWDVKIIEEQ